MIHLYLADLPHDTEVHFVPLFPPGDKYAAWFYSQLVMDHFYKKAVEEATKHIMGFETEGQGGVNV